jgi:hypothetical protein
VLQTFACFKFATIMNVTITSGDHKLHLPTRTADHAPRRFG